MPASASGGSGAEELVEVIARSYAMRLCASVRNRTDRPMTRWRQGQAAVRWSKGVCSEACAWRRSAPLFAAGLARPVTNGRCRVCRSVPDGVKLAGRSSGGSCRVLPLSKPQRLDPAGLPAFVRTGLGYLIKKLAVARPPMPCVRARTVRCRTDDLSDRCQTGSCTGCVRALRPSRLFRAPCPDGQWPGEPERCMRPC